MKTIKVKKENGEIVCDPTSTRASANEQIVWNPEGVGEDVVIVFEDKSPFAERGPFRLDQPHTIRGDAEKGRYKFKHIKGDIIVT